MDPSELTAPRPGTGARLEINSPLSRESIDRLLAAATAHDPRTIIDHGCGWGTVLLRAAALAPDARGRGLDIHGPDIDRARRAAEDLGLADRVSFEVGSSADDDATADLVLSIGAFHAFGTPAQALDALAARLAPGGRLLFGIEYWRTPPTTEELGHMWEGASLEDCADLPALVDLLLDAGWRVLDLHDSTVGEFDAFEIGHLREREEWLTEHWSQKVHAEQAASWSSWLRGHRRSMGFATLLLGRAAAPAPVGT